MKKLTFKQRLERGEGISHPDVGKRIPGSCIPGPEADEGLASLRKREEDNLAVAACESVRAEVTEVSGD